MEVTLGGSPEVVRGTLGEVVEGTLERGSEVVGGSPEVVKGRLGRDWEVGGEMGFVSPSVFFMPSVNAGEIGSEVEGTVLVLDKSLTVSKEAVFVPPPFILLPPHDVLGSTDPFNPTSPREPTPLISPDFTPLASFGRLISSPPSSPLPVELPLLGDLPSSIFTSSLEGSMPLSDLASLDKVAGRDFTTFTDSDFVPTEAGDVVVVREVV